MKDPKLTKDESVIENSIDTYETVSKTKRDKVMQAVGNTKTSITLRIDASDLGVIKKKAENEGMPYQTLISSILHKYINGSLVDENSIKKVVSILEQK
jgi:predicted DNA binding CopG/RHH family protein